MRISNKQSGSKKVRFVVKHTDRLLVAWDIIVCGLIAVAGLIIINFVYPFEPPEKFLIGLLLGCASSVIKVILMRISLEKTMDMDKEGAASRGKLHSIGRYGISLGAVILAICLPNVFGVFGLIAGILSLQFAALIVSRFYMKGDKYDAKGNKLYFRSKESE